MVNNVLKKDTQKEYNRRCKENNKSLAQAKKDIEKELKGKR